MRRVLVPNPLDTDLQFARFHHLDVPCSDDMQLIDELDHLRVRLWGLPPDHWLRERVRILKNELRKRGKR